MGRNKRKGRGRNGPRKESTKQWERSDELEMSNERFERYYKAQNIIPDSEWTTFLETLKMPLPTTFRIASNRQMKDVLSDAIRNSFVPALQTAKYNEEPLPVPKPIAWYPEESLAWHIQLGRKELKKAPEYKRFHEFLVYETEVGNISRQEAVSMLPPLFLDVKPHHNVIDLCAAPGSKTSQLLEAMDSPSGILIANDADHRRAHLLVHQSSRLPSPALMVTNLDASVFPSLKCEGRPLRFDRVLADVPCSGDGTMRKNVGIWKSWSALEGNGLHILQLRILQRAMRMLKYDSVNSEDSPRIVYSTCSLNPVENEAVIAAAINSIPGFELIDVSTCLPSLVRRPGMTTWRPAVDRDVNMNFRSYKEYMDFFEARWGANRKNVGEGQQEVSTANNNIEVSASTDRKDRERTRGKERDASKRNKMLSSHWPPENAAELNLDRCMRIYPHLQDSGGFFVAVIERLRSPKQHEASAVNSPLLREVNETIRQSKSENREPRISADVEEPGAAEGEPPSKRQKLAFSPSMFKECQEENDARLDSYFKEREAGEATVREVIAATSEGIIGVRGEAGETGGQFKEDPYTFIDPENEVLSACFNKLSLSPSFPRSNLFVRNPEGSPVRGLYLVNDAVKAVMDATDYRRMRLVSAGVKLLGRSELGTSTKFADSSAPALDPSVSSTLMADDTENPDERSKKKAKKVEFRVLNEGLLALLPYLDVSKLTVGGPGALRIFLESYYPLCATFDSEIKDQLHALVPGSHIIRFAPGDYGGAMLSHDLYLPIWKSDVSVSLMVDKKAKSALSVRFFGEDITVAGTKAREQKEQKMEVKAANSAASATQVTQDKENAEVTDGVGDDDDGTAMDDDEDEQ